jgi:hypothetical protein
MFVPYKTNRYFEKKYHFIREIPAGLDITAQKGSMIERDSILASGEVPEEKDRIDAATELRCNPTQLKKYLQCLNGEMVERGSVLARRAHGVISKEKIVKAPRSGLVNLSEVSSGFIRIMGAGVETTIQSGVKGKIYSVLSSKYVDIETPVVKVKPYKIFGESVQGEMYLLSSDKQAIGPNLSGGIVLCSFDRWDEVFLRSLALNGVVGVIVSSIDYSLLEQVKSAGFWGMTIIVIEGLGEIPYNPETLEIFEENDGYLSNVDHLKKEIILTNVFQSEKNGLQKFVKKLEVGNKVQVFSSTSWGSYGIVEEIVGETVKVYTKHRLKNESIEVSAYNVVVCQ